MGAEFDKQAVLEIAQRHGARGVQLFGSFLHGQQRADSDVDLLVELDPGRDLFDLIELKQELEAKLGRRVDVLTEKSLSPYIRAQVLREARPL